MKDKERVINELINNLKNENIGIVLHHEFFSKEDFIFLRNLLQKLKQTEGFSFKQFSEMIK